MKRVILGALLAIGVMAAPAAQAQSWGHAPQYERSPWGHDEWRDRMERREMRREFWRQQRELAERRAYEAGKRDAYQQSFQQPRWGYR